jgi:hypothetical protein
MIREAGVIPSIRLAAPKVRGLKRCQIISETETKRERERERERERKRKRKRDERREQDE